MARRFIEFEVQGADVLAGLDHLKSQMLSIGGRALREEAEIEMTEAKERTPVDTGALRASGRVTGPETKGSDIEVKLAFGNASAEYALYVHEDIDAFHNVGQAKYLESTLNESAPHLPGRIGKRIADILKETI